MGGADLNFFVFFNLTENIYTSQNVSNKDSGKISDRLACNILDFYDSTTTNNILLNQYFDRSKWHSSLYNTVTRKSFEHIANCRIFLNTT